MRSFAGGKAVAVGLGGVGEVAAEGLGAQTIASSQMKVYNGKYWT
jgi:hypothetical protein